MIFRALTHLSITLLLLALSITLLHCGGCSRNTESKSPTPELVVSKADEVTGTKLVASLDIMSAGITDTITLKATSTWDDGATIEWIDPVIISPNTDASLPSIRKVRTGALVFDSGEFSQTIQYEIAPELPGTFAISRVGVRVDQPDRPRRICRVSDLAFSIESSLGEQASLTLDPSIGFVGLQESVQSRPNLLIFIGPVILLSAGILLLTIRSRPAPEHNDETDPIETLRILSTTHELDPANASRSLRSLQQMRDVEESVYTVISHLEHAQFSGNKPRTDAIRSSSAIALSALEGAS